MSLIATIVCFAAVAGLFALDHDAFGRDRASRGRGARISPALWIPTIWMLINGSRPVSQWLHPGSAAQLSLQSTESSPLDAAIFGLLMLAGLVVLNFRVRRAGDLLRRNLPVILFFGYCAVSIFWSGYPFIAIKRYSKAIGDLAMVLVVLTDADPLAAIQCFFKRVTFILLPVSALLIYFYPGLGTAFDPLDRVTMYVGVTTFKNLLGMILMVCGISSVWCFLGAYEDAQRMRRGKHLLVHGLMILTAVLLLLKCDSMTSFACFGLASAVMILSTQRWTKRRPGRIHLVFAGALILPLFALFMDSGMVQLMGRKANLTDRTSIWHAVLAMHSNPFVGRGFESFWMGSTLQRVWDLSVHGIQEAHNGYLEVYINLGWIGELFLIAMIVTAYPKILSMLRRTPCLGKLALAYFAAGLIYSLTEAGFRMMNPIWIAFLLAIVSTGLQIGAREGKVALPSLQIANKGATPKRQIRVLQ